MENLMDRLFLAKNDHNRRQRRHNMIRTLAVLYVPGTSLSSLPAPDLVAPTLEPCVPLKRHLYSGRVSERRRPRCPNRSAAIHSLWAGIGL